MNFPWTEDGRKASLTSDNFFNTQRRFSFERLEIGYWIAWPKVNDSFLFNSDFLSGFCWPCVVERWCLVRGWFVLGFTFYLEALLNFSLSFSFSEARKTDLLLVFPADETSSIVAKRLAKDGLSWGLGFKHRMIISFIFWWQSIESDLICSFFVFSWRSL